MEPVEEIKSRLSIEDVVGRLVDLKRSGASYKGLCPFHQEKTPSFYVTPSRGTYHCFGCGKGGDLFSFVMETERLSFPEALRKLADQAGVDLPEREQKAPSLKRQLYAANEAAAHFFLETLRGARGSSARQYLQERRLDAAAVEAFDLGYAPPSRDELARHLRQAGFDDRILLAAGLILQDESGGQARDRFHGRLMFPIRDASGKISGFGGRTLRDAQPKYLNSPQTEIFDKSASLFGIHRAVDAMRASRRAVLVEGYFDAIRAQISGYPYVVASLGTAVTSQQLMALSRLTDTVILALDPDAAGQSAAARTSLAALAEVTRARGRATGAAGALDLRVARLPSGGGDPDELIRDRVDLWEAALAGAVSAFEFYFRQTLASLDRNTEDWRQTAIDRLLPIIQQFAGSAGWQAEWVERLASETGVDPRILQRSMPSAGSGAPEPRRTGRMRGPRTRETEARSVVSETTARAVTADPALAVERALVALLLTLVVVPDEAARILESTPMDYPVHRAIVDALLRWRANGNFDYEMFRETLPEDVRPAAGELRALEPPPPDDGKVSVAVAYHLARLRQFRVQAQLSRVRDALQDIDPGDRQGTVESLAVLMSERLKIEEELERLSRQAVQSSGAAHLESGHD